MLKLYLLIIYWKIPRTKSKAENIKDSLLVYCIPWQDPFLKQERLLESFRRPKAESKHVK